MRHQSLAEMFLSQAKRYGGRVLYRFVKENQWLSYTWDEAHRRVREIGLGLMSLGVNKGDRVAIFSSNRVEWSLIDWANICIGALTVPLYSSSTPAQVVRIVEHSESTILFVESQEMRHGADEPAVEHAARQALPLFVFQCFQEARADARGRGDFVQRDAAHFSLAFQGLPKSALGHCGKVRPRLRCRPKKRPRSQYRRALRECQRSAWGRPAMRHRRGVANLCRAATLAPGGAIFF